MTGVWDATEADIEDGLAIAVGRYGEFDLYSAKMWALAYLDHPQVCLLRSRNVISCVVHEVRFWRPRDLFAKMVFFASREGAGPMEAYRVIQAQKDRARSRGCVEFEMGSVTGVDLGPFARRLGLSPAGANYVGAP